MRRVSRRRAKTRPSWLVGGLFLLKGWMGLRAARGCLVSVSVRSLTHHNAEQGRSEQVEGKVAVDRCGDG